MSIEAKAILKALLDAIEHSILPVSTQDEPELFGAAILSWPSLAPLTVATNQSDQSPVSHGELNCIQKFHTVDFPDANCRPDPRDCVFVSSHEPCSMCLSAIAWAQIPQVYYLFSYQETKDIFGMADDIEIIEQLFPRSRAVTADESPEPHLYNRDNAYFRCRSLTQAAEGLTEPLQRDQWAREIDRVKDIYVNGFGYRRAT